jgi:hypothetical protein
MPLDASSNPMQQAGFGNNTQAAGLLGISQPPNPENTNPSEDITPEPLEVDNKDAVTLIHLSKLKMTQKFIDMLCVASLDNMGMNLEDLDTLCNPDSTLKLIDPSSTLN